jgi:hypothetical protein
MNDTRIAIGLELDQTDDCLSGRITRPDGETVEFSGWLGLVAALDAVLEAPAEGERAGPIPPQQEGDQR